MAVGVVKAVVSDPVAAVVVAAVLDAADSAVVDVVKFALAGARLRRCVWLLSYLPSDNPLKLTQVSPSEPSFSDMQFSYLISVAQRMSPSLVTLASEPPRQAEQSEYIILLIWPQKSVVPDEDRQPEQASM